MSLYSLNIKPKCYKVVCNLLDPDEEYTYSNIDHDFDIDNYETKIAEIRNHYTSPNNSKQMVFLFVGEFDDPIKSILDQINNFNEFNRVSSEDIMKLSTFFGYDINKEWNIISNENVKKIYFVPYLIHDFDNISYLHTLISSVISNYTKNNEPFYRQLVKTSEIFMYTNQIIHVEKQFEDFKKNILIAQKNKSYSFNIEFVETKLLQLGISKNIIDKLLAKYNNDLTRITEIFEDNILKELYIVYKNFVPLTVMIKHRRDYIFNSTNVLDKIYGETTDISDNVYKVENALFENQLRNITNSNILYLYTQINLTKFITSKFKDSELTNYYGLLYRYYFYNTKKTDIKSIISKNIASNYEQIIQKYDILSYIVKTLDTYNLFENNEDNESFSNIDVQPYIINIRTHLNFPNNYNFLELFNNISLSSDIPFTKFRDTVANDIVFKIFKPITYSDGIGYLPEVSIDELNNWIKYKGFELDNFKIKPIKSNPREVFFKLKIETFYTNNILSGIIEKIIINDTDTIIYNIKSNNDIITGVDKNLANVSSRDEDIDDIVEGTEVYFNEKKTIYADLEIYKRGVMNISVNAQQYENDDNYELELIVKKIFNSINQFINTIFEEDRLLVQYQQFKNNFTEDIYLNDNIYTLTDYSENNIYSNNSILISTENKYALNWYNIYDLLELLYPLIDIPEEKFEKGDEVIYQDQEGIATDTFDAIVKTKNENDNTYSISYKLSGQTITKDNVKSRFLSLRGNYDKSLIVFYFKTNKGLVFDKSNKIFKFIDKSRIIGYNIKEIIDRLRENFPGDIDTPQDAQDKIEEFLDNTGLNMKTFNSYTDTNPQITINLGSVKKLDNQFFETEIYVENITDYYTYKQINKLISFIYNCYNYKFHTDEYTNNYVKNLLDSTSEVSKIKLNEIEHAIKADVTSDTRVGANLFEDIRFEGDDFIDSDIEDDDEDEDDDPSINNEDDIKQAFKNDSMIIGQSRLSKNTILDNLYNKAPKLFYWENKENPRKTYTGICQGVKRYPKILSEEQKKAIDERDNKFFKGELSNPEVNNKNFLQITKDLEKYTPETEASRSYNTSLSDLSNCESKPSDSKKCSAIKYGTESNKNWYICPKIYDIKDNVPLHWTMLNYNKIDGKTFIPLNYNDITQWRTDANTGRDILEYKPTFKGRGVVNTKSNKVAPTSKNSLVLIDKGSQYSYPGFLIKSSNPNGFFPPCCYNSNMRIGQAFDPKTTITSGRNKNTYIQGQFKELGYSPLRYGILPDELSNILDNNKSVCTTGDLSDKKKCFFRLGNLQGNNSFLALMCDIFFDQINVNYIKSFIVSSITQEQFKTLNGGSLEIKFRNYGKQSSFQNFLEYTLSDEYKDYSLYYEFFTYFTEELMDNKWFSKTLKKKFTNIKPDTNKPNIFHLIFDTVYTKNDKGIPIRKYELLCPYFMKNLYRNYNSVEFFTISIKNKDSFEPIYYLNGSTKTIKIFNFKIPSEDNDNETFAHSIRKIANDIINRCNNTTESDIVQISKHIGGPRSEIYSKNNYKIFDIFIFYIKLVEYYPKIIDKISQYMPDSLLIDDYNRVYGIILNNRSIIPIYPDIIDTNLISMFNRFMIRYYIVKTQEGVNLIVSKHDIDIKDSKVGNIVNVNNIHSKSTQKCEVIDIKTHQYDISYKFNYNRDYEKTNLNTHLESYAFIKEYSKKLSNIQEIDIKPIYYFTDNQNNVNGFIANTGSYINIQEDILTETTSNLIRNNYYDIDKELIEYQKLLFHNVYKEPSKLSEIIRLINKINVDTKNELFNFTKIYKHADKLIGIMNSINIFIPIKSELISKYQEFISTNNIEVIELVENKTEPMYNVSIQQSQITIKDYESKAKEMSNALDNLIPMKVTGYKMDDIKKCIFGIILDTGFIVELNPDLRFEMKFSLKDDNDFKINTLLNSIFTETASQQLINLKPKTNKDKILSEFNYSLSSYRVNKYVIFKLLQNSNYRFIREFIKNTVYSIQINNFVKKLSLIPIMNLVLKITTKIIDIKPDIYPNISIDNVGNLDKCIGNHIEKSDNSWVSKFNSISDLDEYINLSLVTIFGEITDENITNIRNIIGIDSDVTSGDLISHIKSKINNNDIDFINNTVIQIYNAFIKIIPKKSCKLKIFKMSNILGKRLIKIIDELIQNNYSKIEILDSFKVLSGNERYKFNKTSEIFLSNKELDNRNKLLELYNNVKKLYYRKILDFDEIKLSAKIVKKSDENRQSEEGCFITNKDTQYINIKVGEKKFIKNNSKLNNRYHTISDRDMAYIFKLNTELTSCISISGGKIESKDTGIKKMLKYEPR